MALSVIPEVQIETITELRDSHLLTFEKQGYTISDIKIDIDNGKEYLNIYNFGVIVKRLYFEKNSSNKK